MNLERKMFKVRYYQHSEKDGTRFMVDERSGFDMVDCINEFFKFKKEIMKVDKESIRLFSVEDINQTQDQFHKELKRFEGWE